MFIMDANEKICINCGNVYDELFSYNFCPHCGKELKKANEIFHVKNIEVETSGGICLFCNEKFYGEEDYCPKCGKKLQKGKINLIKRTFETKWNYSKIMFSFISLSGRYEPETHPFQVARAKDVLMQKSYFDEKLKEDRILFNQPKRQKLTYNQVKSSINSIRAYFVDNDYSEFHFITVENINEQELWKIFSYKGSSGFGYHVNKIGKNLYLIFDTSENIKSKLKDYI